MRSPGTLGEQIVLFRIVVPPDEQLQKCRLRRSGGGARLMREEVAQATLDLFASLPNPLPEPAGMDDVEDARLNRAVLLAIRMRAGIVRTATTGARSMMSLRPGRPSTLLSAAIRRAPILIGVPRAEAYEVVEQVVFDFDAEVASQGLSGAHRQLAEHERDRDQELGCQTRPHGGRWRISAAQGLAERKEASTRVSRGGGRFSTISVEHWKLTPKALALTIT